MPQSQVSVVISNYNYARYLPEAIDSVLSQTLSNFELIIVDDNSTDSSRSIIEAYAKKDARIRFYKQNKEGLLATLNNLALHATTPLIANLDADNWWGPLFLEKMVARLDEQPRRVGCFSSYKSLSDDGKEQPHMCYRVARNIEGVELVRRLSVSNCLNSSSGVFRRDAITSQPMARNFSHVHDWDLWLRISMKGDILLTTDELTFFRWHDNNMTIGAEKILAKQQINVLDDLFLNVASHYQVEGEKDLLARKEARIAHLAQICGDLKRAIIALQNKSKHCDLTLTEIIQLSTCYAMDGQVQKALDVVDILSRHSHALPLPLQQRISTLRQQLTLRSKNIDSSSAGQTP